MLAPFEQLVWKPEYKTGRNTYENCKTINHNAKSFNELNTKRVFPTCLACVDIDYRTFPYRVPVRMNKQHFFQSRPHRYHRRIEGGWPKMGRLALESICIPHPKRYRWALVIVGKPDSLATKCPYISFMCISLNYWATAVRVKNVKCPILDH